MLCRESIIQSLCCECRIAFYCTQYENKRVKERLKILATDREIRPAAGRMPQHQKDYVGC